MKRFATVALLFAVSVAHAVDPTSSPACPIPQSNAVAEIGGISNKQHNVICDGQVVHSPVTTQDSQPPEGVNAKWADSILENIIRLSSAANRIWLNHCELQLAAREGLYV